MSESKHTLARECRTCGGTGRILSRRTMFIADGFSKSRCGICGGSGHSSYRDDPKYVRFQAEARVAIAKAEGR